jgi:hypothetical protein
MLCGERPKRLRRGTLEPEVHDRLAGKAFFTLAQTSKVLPLIDDLTTHIAIWRITPNGDTLVYRGAVIDRNTTGDDVIIDGCGKEEKDLAECLTASSTGTGDAGGTGGTVPGSSPAGPPAPPSR